MVADRNRSATLAHSSRRPFFSTPLESEHDSPRVTKDAMDRGQRCESREAVQVAKLSCCWHRSIVTRFRGEKQTILPRNNRVSTVLIGRFHPLQDAKSQLTKLRVLDLTETEIDDKAIEEVVKLKSLSYLSLSNTKISPRSIKHLGRLTQLKTLVLMRNRISGGSFADFDKLLLTAAQGCKLDRPDVPGFQGDIAAEKFTSLRRDQ